MRARVHSGTRRCASRSQCHGSASAFPPGARRTLTDSTCVPSLVCGDRVPAACACQNARELCTGHSDDHPVITLARAGEEASD
eukprot:6208214-Pleurochrysis_carterae.AAC.1